MNRKGFSTQTRCSECGYVVKCERCDVNLTHLFSKKKMVCRLCQFSRDLPKVCPQCQGDYLKSSGIGGEKLGSELSRILPGARVAHYDKDTKAVPKNFDVLISTQAILRIQEKIAVDLVGVINIDSSLNRLDFRAGEGMMALLVRLMRLSTGKIMIQTRIPENYCLKAVQKMDFNNFYRQELKLRQELNLPPFCHLIAIGLRSTQEEVAFEQASLLFAKMDAQELNGVEIAEPQPDVLPKLRDKYRFTIFVKGKSVKRMLIFIKETLKSFRKKGGVVVTVNVDA